MDAGTTVRPQPDPFDGRVAPPWFASIETTMFCNLRCPMCFQFLNGTTVAGPHMELGLFEKLARELFPWVESMQPSVSGEPLMSRGLDRMLALAQAHGVRLEYTTNGTLLTGAMIARILPTLGSLFVSFDGATRATFEELRRGASFDQVVANVRELMAAVRDLPPAERPVVGLNCTLMRRNVEELPAIVELAHELGVDLVSALHVFAASREMQSESLAHHRALAADCIARAAARAGELGMPLTVHPLDAIQSAMADAEQLPDRFARALAGESGPAGGLPRVAVHLDRLHRVPFTPAPAGAGGQRERRAGIARELRPPRPAAERPAHPPIWVCDFLWNKIYVGREGAVSPCCVPGIPILGNLLTQTLDEVWNGDSYCALREGLAARDPAPCCRGCQFTRELTDPAEIDRWLGGRRVAVERDRALPRPLRPVTRAPVARDAVAPDATPAAIASATPPELRWQPRAGAEEYEVELSLDGFRNVAFSTTWHHLRVPEPSFRIPAWTWELAPRDRAVGWRALAVLARERVIVATGAVLAAASGSA